MLRPPRCCCKRGSIGDDQRHGGRFATVVRVSMRSRDVIDDWSDDPWDDAEQLEAAPEGFERLRGASRAGRWLALLAILTVTGFVAAIAASLLWVVHRVDPPGDPGAPVTFQVTPGQTLSAVANELERAKIVQSATVLRWYAKWKGQESIVAGTFQLRPNDDLGSILKTLRTPPEQVLTKVTIPEGLRLEQIAARLHEKIPRLSADRFLELARAGAVTSDFAPPGTNLEGLLFPDTYEIAASEDELAVLRQMVNQMNRIAKAKAHIDTSFARVFHTPYEVLTIASLIEREAKVSEDRPKIARVIYNRLGKSDPPMRLEVDATVFYAAGLGVKSFEEAKAKADGSPYNTYQVFGLPPTPIAAPGFASIYAAMNPSSFENHWLFYVVADAEGRHAFADNVLEHLANVDRARRAGLLK